MKYTRIYSFHGEPMADVFLGEGSGCARLELLTPIGPVSNGFDLGGRIMPEDQYRYSYYEIMDQKALTARPAWLEPT